jgi:AcrR family transcriptional regulator
MDAGLQIFGTTGYRTATVRMLCKQAQLTDRYFYESFNSTEDLLVAVYQQQFEYLQHAVMTELAAGASGGGDVMTTVRAGLAALIDMAAEPRVARVCWLEVLGVSPRVDETYIRMFNGFAYLVIGFTRQRFPQWKVDDDEARMLGLALIGAVSQTVTHWVLGQYRESRQTLLAVTSRVFEGVLASIEKGR